MDYDSIVDASHNFFSLKKLVWFLVLFWLAFPVLVFVPWAIEKNYFLITLEPIVMILFAVMYSCVFFGLIFLLQHSFFNKKIGFSNLSIKKSLMVVPLVFVEMFYVFIWNLHKPFRFTQILLLLGIPLLYYYRLVLFDPLIYAAFTTFFFFYIILVIHNFVRLIFTVPLYFVKDETIFESPKSSWVLTHKKFNNVFIALVLILGVLFIIFSIFYLIFSFISYFILSFFVLPRIANELSIISGIIFALAPVLVAYYSSFTELFNQLLKEVESSNKIKSILSKKVLLKTSVKSFSNKKIKKKLKKRK